MVFYKNVALISKRDGEVEVARINHLYSFYKEKGNLEMSIDHGAILVGRTLRKGEV